MIRHALDVAPDGVDEWTELRPGGVLLRCRIDFRLAVAFGRLRETTDAPPVVWPWERPADERPLLLLRGAS